MEKRRVRIVETVLRDGHQSILATRMRTRHMVPFLEALDNVGYEALEAWGGATYDSMVRFLDEDPWARLRILKQYCKKTPIQMLLRGQNLLGYRHYANDIVREFCHAAKKNGIDRIRIFDALNDTRNMEAAIRASKEAGIHVQGAMVYTISPVHTDESFVKVAKELKQMGIDSLCIKDMSGLLAPYDSIELIKKLRAALGDTPIDLHSHFTTGLANMTYVKAVEAGVDIIDTALSPFGYSTSQPATESMVITFQGTPYDTGLDLNALQAAAEYFRGVKKDICNEFNLTVPTDIIPEVRRYQIPGGMLSNTRNQLKEMGMEDKFFDVLAEMPKVREELGFPPLVTPTSQIVGTMATMNVMAGERYKMVPGEVKDLVRGKYGRLPGEITEEIRKKVLGDEAPQDFDPRKLPDQLDELKAELEAKGYAGLPMEDVLTYAMMPPQALEFFEKNRQEYKVK